MLYFLVKMTMMKMMANKKMKGFLLIFFRIDQTLFTYRNILYRINFKNV